MGSPKLDLKIMEIDENIQNHATELANIVSYRPLVTETYISTSLQNFIDNNTNVKIKKGDYVLDVSIKIPSNRSIEIEEGTTFTLKSGCNQYMFQNADLINGNTNINIRGGWFDGNGSTNTRNYTGATLNDVYYGFGLFFSKVKNLKLKDIKMNNTTAWAIAGNCCEDVVIDNIEILQDMTSYSSNKDGVTFSGGKNIKVNNIRGCTSDDLVAMCGWGAQMASTELLFDLQNMENVSITNVTSLTVDGKSAQTCISLYQRLGLTVKNVSIDNVKGDVNYCPIQIKGLDVTTPHFFNINISNVNCDKISTAVGIIQINANVDTINITNLNRHANDNKATIYILGTVDTINISNVNNKWDTTMGSFIYDMGNVKNINLNNISLISLTNANGFVYTKNSVSSTVTTKLQGSNITLNSNLYSYSVILKMAGNIAVNSISMSVDKTLLTPFVGDIIKEISSELLRNKVAGWSNLNDKYKQTFVGYYNSLPASSGIQTVSFNGGNNKSIVMTTSGSITGLALNVSAAKTAGTITVQVYKSGNTPLDAILLFTSVYVQTISFPKDTVPFNANDVLTVKISSSSDLAPLNDVSIVMTVEN